MNIKAQVQVAEQLFKRIPILALPDEVLQLRDLLNSSDYPSPSKIKELVGANPALAGEIIGLANDICLNSNTNVQTIDAAIDLLGLIHLKNYIVAIEIKKMVEGSSIKGLAFHSIQIAKICAIIAKHTKIISFDEAYLMGLVHDIGTFLLAEIDSLYAERFSGQLIKHYSIQALEFEKYGTTHSAVGYVATQAWGISQTLSKGILLHHEEDLQRINDPKVRQAAALLELSHSLAAEMRQNISHTETATMYKHALKALDIPSATLEQIKRDIHR